MTRDRINLGVFCTDKGQHPWTLLGDLTAALDGGMVRANMGAVYGVVADRRKDECVWLDHLEQGKAEYRVHMRCPRCGRHVEWKHDRVVEVLTQFHAAALERFDLSSMP